MSVTIEDVMRLAEEYRDASTFSGSCVAKRELRAAVSALVAQARDEEAEACIGMLASVGHDNPMTANDCIDLIRARIAGRKA